MELQSFGVVFVIGILVGWSVHRSMTDRRADNEFTGSAMGRTMEAMTEELRSVRNQLDMLDEAVGQSVRPQYPYDAPRASIHQRLNDIEALIHTIRP